MLSKNYHTHLYLCNHATGNTEDYVKRAIEDKYEVLGISDHCPIMKEWFSENDYYKLYVNENMKYDEFYDIYLPSIEKCIEKYGDKIEILSGIESEYIPMYHEFYEEIRYQLDYMILGMHFFYYDGKYIDVYDNLDGKMAIEYAKSISVALDTELFTYLAHPDLYLYDYCGSEKYVFDEDAKTAARIILEACQKNDILVEINCGGMRYDKKYKDEFLYPRTEFFNIAKEYDVKFIIGCDAHQVEALDDEHINDAIEFCKRIGITPINIK